MTTFAPGYKGPKIDPMIDKEGFRKLIQSNPPDPRIPVVGATPPPPRRGKGFPISPTVQQPVRPGMPNPDPNIPFVLDNKPVPVLPRTRPPRPVTTGGPLVKPPQPGMTGLAGMNPKMAQKLGKVGAALGKKLGMKKGGAVSSASKRADGCAIKGKTKGKMV